MKRVILKIVPLGTPLEVAQRLMAEEGFLCFRRTKASVLDREGIDSLWCDRLEGGIVQRRWQVALVHRDGRVTEVLPSTGLVGP